YASATEDDADFTSKQELAIRFLKRYATQSPDDPRPHEMLAEIYAARKEQAAAEAEYRDLIKLDQFDPGNYFSLASFLVTQKRYKDALAVVDQTRGRGTSKDKVFANLFFTMFGEPGGAELAEGLAAESTGRLIDNFDANVNLATVRILVEHPREALPLLKRAIQLDSRNATPHTLIAAAQRQLRNWAAALKSADAALTLDEKDSDAYFHRACALAQLRRSAEAVAALRKALELDGEMYSAGGLEEEADLKPLTGVPAFKKLVEELKRSERAPADQQKKEAAKQI
ncbi:MAG TPA: tetratricopeptide repeat protein, partial [Blastocatellia bacterium]|nr:tetratricopeptide repeat protein [Blastocatellia bacterium]